MAHGSGGAQTRTKVGTELHAGARLVTGPNASAVLRFADGSELLVRPDSEVHMNELGVYGQAGLFVDSRARLQRGRIEVQVPPGPGSRLEITTPSASALVRGTQFRVSSEAEVSRAEVEEGTVRVTGATSSIQVTQGTGTVVRAGQPPAPARALLEAPSLDALPARLERRQPRLRWPPVDGAEGYRIQVATRARTATLLVDLPASSPRLTLPDLPDGAYELRVRAVDAAGLEGLDARHRFELDARPEPPATVEPRPGATVRVTAPTLRWGEPVDARGYHLQVATDPAFDQLVIDRGDLRETTLQPGGGLAAGEYFWRLASIDATGEQGPYGDAQAFTVRPAPPAPSEADAQVGETDVLLRWREAEPGQTYEVEVADSADFTGDVRREGTDEPQLIIPTPEHDLWFRVRIVDTDGYRGPYSTPNRIAAPREDPWWLLAVPVILILL
jgi:hypothetical protein